MANEQNYTDLNAKILKITMTIKELYPELSKYLEEMPVSIPKEANPELTLQYLKNYYASLLELLSKYKLNNPTTGNESNKEESAPGAIIKM